jgi:hypothetical protein
MVSSRLTMTTALPRLGAAVRHEFALSDDFLTVNHAAMGRSAGLRSLPLAPGDDILCPGHARNEQPTTTGRRP